MVSMVIKLTRMVSLGGYWLTERRIPSCWGCSISWPGQWWCRCVHYVQKSIKLYTLWCTCLHGWYFNKNLLERKNRKHFVFLVTKPTNKQNKTKTMANVLLNVLFYLSLIFAGNSDDLLINTLSLGVSFSLRLCSQCSFFTPLSFLCQVPTC